jgi:hypothetical protein
MNSAVSLQWIKWNYRCSNFRNAWLETAAVSFINGKERKMSLSEPELSVFKNRYLAREAIPITVRLSLYRVKGRERNSTARTSFCAKVSRNENRNLGDWRSIRTIRNMSSTCVAVIFNLFCSRTPRYNLSSTLYPQSCWYIMQVIHIV